MRRVHEEGEEHEEGPLRSRICLRIEGVGLKS